MNQNRFTRRRFMFIAGGALGAAALSCAGVSALDARKPEIEFSASAYGEEKTMNGRILVAYASRHGATAGVAEAIGKTLAEGSVAVDVRPMKEIKEVSAYRAVVMGSAIHGGKWMPEAMDFVQANQSELSRMPTATFLVCLMLASATTPYRDQVPNWLEPVRALVRPVAEGLFAGALSYRQYGVVEGLGMRIFAATIKIAEGDYRDWDAISAWADRIRPLLLG